MVQGNPDLDEILVDDRRCKNRGPWGFWREVLQLRKRHFDVALILHTKRRANWLCFFSGIPHRVGFCFDKSDFLLTLRIRDFRSQGLIHESRNCLDVLKQLGIKEERVEMFLPLRPENEMWVDDLFKQMKIDSQKPIIAIHPGASCPTKKWPEKFFIEVAQQILKTYSCQIFLVGSVDARENARHIFDAVHGPIFDLTGKTTVGQLASLLKRCRMLISNDSGPVHVAAALGIGVVSIFTRNQGGINPER